MTSSKTMVRETHAVLVIHGGAGAPDRATLTPASEREHRDTMIAALRAGYEILRQPGGTALDAAQAAVIWLEDSPLFNAGRGSVFSREGTIEQDAAIADGATRKAGAVAGINRVRNPILAARAVMEKSPHVLMIGEGAERFAFQSGCDEVSPLYFWTEEAWKEMQEIHRQVTDKASTVQGRTPHMSHGTVGAVALDPSHNLAAATSTGGLTYKRSGRVGDTPVIGAGTFADNGTCAVSCTGRGEIFIRYCVAHDIHARMKYTQQSLFAATETVLNELPREAEGVGGLIALDRMGNFAAPFNTRGMFRGHVTQDGRFHVAIYPE
jgi:beta-aspartyl-peptidase (threonine type)